MKKIKKIILILLVIVLSACSSQRVVSKELSTMEINYSIKDEQQKIVEVKLTNGKFYNFSIDKRYSYILKENTFEIFKLGASEVEININEIESYSVEKINEFSIGRFIFGIPVGIAAAIGFLVLIF